MIADKKELANALFEIGQFYFFNERYDEALRVLKKSADLNKKEPETYYQMGLVYEAKNESMPAKEMYLKALELNPRLSVAQEHLDRLVGK